MSEHPIQPVRLLRDVLQQQDSAMSIGSPGRGADRTSQQAQASTHGHAVCRSRHESWPSVM